MVIRIRLEVTMDNLDSELEKVYAEINQLFRELEKKKLISEFKSENPGVLFCEDCLSMNVTKTGRCLTCNDCGWSGCSL